jgi:hypothetical protein
VNREERRALKLIITDRVEKEAAKENERRRKAKERLESEHQVLIKELFNNGKHSGRLSFDEPETHWGNDGILKAEAKLKLTSTEHKRLKDSKHAIARVGEPIIHLKPDIDLVMAETVLGDKADALKKVDAIVKEIMKRLLKKN